jgi:UDP-N-acetylglucosamine/UDP-N-acetylgalactosamine diphosphorylase
MSDRERELRTAFEAAGQGHVFRTWDRIGEGGRRGLLDQLEAVDLALVSQLAALLVDPEPDGGAPAFEPPDVFPLERGADERARVVRAEARGEELLRAGEVGYLLVAGGQASRLGYDGPKGCFPVGPVSGRPLFEVHARRLLAARKRYGVSVPWYVMTSPANDAATRSFFAEHEHFGLPAEDVFFFSQAMLPALDLEGRILSAAEDELFLAPNGHGGVLAALRTSGALDDARRRGVETLSFFQVDNPLVRPVDPLFLGLHALEGASMSSKVVAKRGPEEKVGVLGRVDGRMGCIEYSDLPAELREARDDAGKLLFDAGNIAVHAIQRDFVEELTEGHLRLPWHVARKRMRVVGEDGSMVEVAGAKFEAFVFDALGRSERSVTLEVARSEQFSPVKNAEGVDSPATARADQCALYSSWAEAAGRPLPDPDPDGNVPIEVCPTFAESAPEFRARMPAQPRELDGGHLYE